MRVSQTSDGLWARRDRRLRAIDVATLPHPGFATDFMPIAVALMSVADGSAIVTENIYDGRFQFVDELIRMGADVRTEGRHAIVRGVERLSGAPVTASDVRAGAALVLAGLVAEGETVVYGCEHVERGYSDLPATLRSLGADVERI
jgi:UDP-N-acetylglucosamine 1-carboxyvinyltransferase